MLKDAKKKSKTAHYGPKRVAHSEDATTRLKEEKHDYLYREHRLSRNRKAGRGAALQAGQSERRANSQEVLCHLLSSGETNDRRLHVGIVHMSYIVLEHDGSA